ncbi:MAG TPA: SDR family oxidoreductase [Paracoccaceae bacterium]|nr:SDR family oxidoreductase [Paracoccaceae bacterium]
MITYPATKSVLVTGAARRIGARIAQAFGAAGWHVVLHCRHSVQQAEALAATLPSAEVVQCDLANTPAALALVEDLASRLPDWRVLVANASLFEEDGATALDPVVATRAWQLNALAPTMMAQSFLARARSTAGRRVIQLTDQKLANPNPDFFSYTMSKHAVDAAAKMLAMACQPQDRVYRLAPGAILPSHDQVPEEAERSHRMNLLGRRTEAGEVAQAALFLATAPLASGQALFVDSGQHLLSQPRDVLYLAREQE